MLLFLFLGGLLFWVESLVSDPEPIYSIAIGPKTIASLEQGWTNRIGRAPDADVLDALIHTQVDDELLIAQARALGWHRNDAIVQRRLVQNQRFVTEDEEITDSELLERAYQQGMDQSDIVVRRRLRRFFKSSAHARTITHQHVYWATICLTTDGDVGQHTHTSGARGSE